MPHLRVYTNVVESKIAAGLAKTLCQVISDTVGKPVTVCSATIIPVGELQSYGGTDEPSAIAVLMSMGNLGIQENVGHSKAIFAALSKGLGITDPARMCIQFNDSKPQDIGFDGTTMFEHLKNGSAK